MKSWLGVVESPASIYGTEEAARNSRARLTLMSERLRYVGSNPKLVS